MIGKRFMRTVLPLALLVLTAAPVAAKSPSPSISLSKTSVKAGFGVTVKGQHFKPKAFVAILFAYPKAGAHSYERFIGNAHVNGSGSFRLQVQIPALKQCGKAMVYGQVVGAKSFVGKKLSLVGCKHIAPPPKPKSP